MFMLDQSFSAENFEKIFNIENRKGNIDKKILSKDYIDTLIEIKKINAKISSIKGQQGNNHPSLEDLYKDIEDWKKINEATLKDSLKIISNIVNENDFQFTFSSCDIRGKTTYKLDKEPISFYAMKQLQYNIKKTFNVKQSNRYLILKQLKTIVSDNFPKLIIRTDIKDFYESVSQNKLLEKIEKSTLLNHLSKKLINNILQHYRDNTASIDNKGIPRGLGISAYLSELYMEDVDKKIRSMDEVIFYARYVDDIIIVIAPKPDKCKNEYYSEIDEVISNNNLTINKEKTKTIDLFNDQKTKIIFEPLNYLGYEFIFTITPNRKGPNNAIVKNTIKFELNLSKSRIDKYLKRAEQAINHFNQNCNYYESKVKSIFFKRLGFLTGNTSLLNSKKGVKVGIYYSNSLLDKNNLKSIKTINNKFNGLINTTLLNTQLGSPKRIKWVKYILERFSFTTGYNEKKFHKFSIDDFKEIKEIWKNE